VSRLGERTVDAVRQRWTREKFVRRTQSLLPDLYRLARRLVGEHSDSEDLVHDTYVKAFRGFHTARLTCDDDCRAWLFRILVNTYRDRYRRSVRGPIVELTVVKNGEMDNFVELAPSPEPGPAILAERGEFVTAAQAAIAVLPPEVRIVASLFLVEGLSYREIATVTECPIGTVMSRLARGRRMLREQLSAFAEPTPSPAGTLAAVAEAGK